MCSLFDVHVFFTDVPELAHVPAAGPHTSPLFSEFLTLRTLCGMSWVSLILVHFLAHLNDSFLWDELGGVSVTNRLRWSRGVDKSRCRRKNFNIYR